MSKATPSTDALPAAGRDPQTPLGARLARRAASLCVALAVASMACVEAPSTPVAEPSPPAARGSPISFAFETTEGGTLRGVDLRGRFTVIAFAATYDLSSQAQLKVLGLVQRDHRPRVNVAALVLDPPENKPLVIAFAQSLRLQFPVALADDATIAGRGAFGDLHAVPAIVILDREGREAHRHIGAYDQKQLEAALDAAGAR